MFLRCAADGHEGVHGGPAAAAAVHKREEACIAALQMVRQTLARDKRRLRLLVAKNTRRANLAAEEQARRAHDKLKGAEEHARLAEEKCQIAEEHARLAEEKRQIAEEQARRADEKSFRKITHDTIELEGLTRENLELTATAALWRLAKSEYFHRCIDATAARVARSLDLLVPTDEKGETRQLVDVIGYRHRVCAAKTELCRQLRRRLPDSFRRRNPDARVVCLRISYGQGTPWSEYDDKLTHGEAVWNRICSHLGIERDEEVPMAGEIEDVVEAVRRAMVVRFSLSDEKHAVVCLLVDEVLRVADRRRASLLDELTSLQQRHLMQGYATFVLVTSLEVRPIQTVEHEQDGSRQRALTPTVLPILTYDDQRGVADMLQVFFLRRAPLTEAQRQELRSTGVLLSRIWSQVDLAGCHFRSLEQSLWRLIESQDSALAKCPSRAEDWFDNLPFVPIPVWSYREPVRAQALRVFRRHIMDEIVWVDEETMSEALRTGMVYVGERDGVNLSRIRPFLHLSQFYGALRSSWCVFSANDVVPWPRRDPFVPGAALSAALVLIADLFHAHEEARPVRCEFVMLAVVASRMLELHTRAGGRHGVSIAEQREPATTSTNLASTSTFITR